LTGLVVDASLTAAWCFEDEETQYARDVLSRAENISFFVPAIWPVEMVNVLLVNERRKRITPADRARAITLFNELAIQVDRPQREYSSMLELASSPGEPEPIILVFSEGQQLTLSPETTKLIWEAVRAGRQPAHRNLSYGH